MGDSQSTTPGWVNTSIRNVISFIFDQPAYWLLGIMYQLFFNVASADLFSNETVMKFYGRVQIILGVFMMFQLAMTILRGIVNPSSFTDAKTGAGNLITRVATSLMLITLMMPISTPGRNEYEIQVNNNGILFGTLYSLQHRILANNTIGRLVLGTNDKDSTYMSDDDTELKKSSRIFTSTILKGFYRINLVPEDERTETPGKDPATLPANRYCPDEDISAYTRVDAEPSEIIAMVDETCGTVLGGLTGHYVIAYNPIISAIVAYVFAFILLSFTIDVAVRAVKLAVLRLIAPIPLISYMDPKGGKDSAFNSWVKLLTTTYLDLFIRLAVVYFVIFLIQDIMIHGIYMNKTSGVIGILSFIIICIGLFVFAKQSPKFIKQAIGLKDDGGKFFSGFNELAAVGAIGTGVVGGAISRGIGTASNVSGGNVGKKIAAGIGGGIAGAVAGGVGAGKTYWGQKEPDRKAIMNQVRSNNARNYANAADESTPFGRFIAGVQANAGFKNSLQTYDDRIKYFGAADSALGRINKAFDNNGDYKITFDDTFANDLEAKGTSKGLSYHFDGARNLVDRDGNIIFRHGHSYSLKEMNDMISRVSASSDVDMKDAVDEAKKQAQGIRFKEIRQIGDTKADRERLVQWVNDPTNTAWTENDLVAYDAAHTIYEVGQKYSNDAVFKDLKGQSFDGPSWGQYKGAAAGAGRKADQIKNSNEYSQAKANAQRAEQQSKK